MNPMHFMLLTGVLSVTTINAAESSAEGGDWDDTLTWVDNAIPADDDEIVINGTVFLKKARSCGNLRIAANGILQNGGDLGWVTLTVNGNLTNDGIIRNNPENYELWLNCGGDVINNGTWTPEKTYFMSEKVQHFSQAENTVFQGLIEKRSAAGTADTFPLVAASDIVLNVSSFNGQGYYDGEYFWGKVDMDEHTLTLKGSTLVRNMILTNTGTFNGEDSASVQSITIDNAITIDGHMTITDAVVTFNDDVTVAGALQNGGSLGWVTTKFKGLLTNDGVIRNNPEANELWVELYGDVVNNGTWTPAKTFFVSEQVQQISQSEDVVFTGILTKKSNAGTADTFPLVAASDITLQVDRFDGQGYLDGEYFHGIVDMASHSLTLKGGTVITRTIIKNADTIICNDSASINSISLEGNSVLEGTVTVTNAEVHFNETVTLNGILQNGGSLGWVTLSINGGIVNNGTIRNNPDGNELWCALKGNIVNNGAWVNKKNTLVDSVDQTITLTDGKTIAAAVIFDALWTTGPYQWKKDGEDLDATSKTLSFDSLSSPDAGAYQCVQDDTNSRTITVIGNGDAIISQKGTPGTGRAPFLRLSTGNGVSFQIQSPMERTYTVELFDLHGRTLRKVSGTLHKGTTNIKLNTLASGMYYAAFESGTIHDSVRFTIAQ